MFWIDFQKANFKFQSVADFINIITIHISSLRSHWRFRNILKLRPFFRPAHQHYQESKPKKHSHNLQNNEWSHSRSTEKIWGGNPRCSVGEHVHLVLGEHVVARVEVEQADHAGEQLGGRLGARAAVHKVEVGLLLDGVVPELIRVF